MRKSDSLYTTKKQLTEGEVVAFSNAGQRRYPYRIRKKTHTYMRGHDLTAKDNVCYCCCYVTKAAMKIVMDKTDVGPDVDDFVNAMRARGCIVTMYFDDDNELVIQIKPSIAALQRIAES